MKIAVVLPPGSCFSASRPNSMETVVRTMAEAGQTPGARLHVYCTEGAWDYNGYTVTTLPTDKGERRRVLADALREFGPDLIEFHQDATVGAKIAREFPEAASLLYRHNAMKPPATPIDRWRYGIRYSSVDGLIFVSESERGIFARDYPGQAARAHAIPNPINAELWRGDVDDRDPVIAFAGRAMPQKGVDLICAALPRVLDRHPGWRAVLMLNDWQHHGEWAEPHVAPLEKRYPDRVQVLRSAPLGEVREHMRRAAIALTPSTWAEPLGLTALEAHAAGAALISSGRGGLKEASGPHALYVPVLSVDALASAMDELIDRPARRRALAASAQTYVFETHTPERRAAQLHALRTRLVEARRNQVKRAA